MAWENINDDEFQTGEPVKGSIIGKIKNNLNELNEELGEFKDEINQEVQDKLDEIDQEIQDKLESLEGGGAGSGFPQITTFTDKFVTPNNESANGKFFVSPDKSVVVYVGNSTGGIAGTNNADLYKVNILTKEITNITNFSSGIRPISFQISPNSSKVAFLANINNSARFDLFTINMDGTGLEQVNAGLTNNSMKVEDNFVWTNDSSRIVFATDEAVLGTRNIYIADYDGSNYLKLNQTNGVFKEFELSKNNSRVVYRVQKTNPDVRSVTLSATSDVLVS